MKDLENLQFAQLQYLESWIDKSQADKKLNGKYTGEETRAVDNFITIDIISPAAPTNGMAFLSRNSFRRTGRLRSRDSRRELYLRAQIAEDADSDD